MRCLDPLVVSARHESTHETEKVFLFFGVLGWGFWGGGLVVTEVADAAAIGAGAVDAVDDSVA